MKGVISVRNGSAEMSPKGVKAGVFMAWLPWQENNRPTRKGGLESVKMKNYILCYASFYGEKSNKLFINNK